jgi:hypothetical protein
MNNTEVLNNLKTITDSFVRQFKNTITKIISKDENRSRTSLIAPEIIFESNTFIIPFTIRNKEAEIDLFSYIIMLKSPDSRHIFVYAKYMNQNITNVTDFGYIKNITEDETDIMDRISKDFLIRFNASKGDFKKISR